MKALPYKYKCPQCGRSISVISNKYPPTCRNNESHSSRTVEMELQDDANEKANH